MRFLCFNSFKYYLVLAFSFQCISGFCQVTADSLNTKSIETLEAAIRGKTMLQQTQQELEFIKQKALKSHNDILLARSLYDLMQIRDQLTEDTLYFRNSAFMDSLLNSSATSSQLKAIIHILHAQRIRRFETKPLRFNRAAYRTKGLKDNYAALNTFLLDSIVNNDINESLKYRSTKAEGNRLLWFSSNPDVFLFEPRFEDIVLAERVNLLAIKRDFNGGHQEVLGSWLSLSSPAFINKLDSLAGNAKNSNDILVAYQRWLSFHKPDPITSSFIESLARKYIYLSASQDSLTRQWYIKYLQEGIASPYLAVKAQSVYQLCLIWNEEGNKYASFGDQYSYQPLPNFDPQYQFYSAKALQLYKQHEDLMYKYPLFNKVLNLMAQQISSKGIRIEIENQHLPDEPVPVRVIYRNTDMLFYRIIRVSSTEPAGKGRVGATAQLLNRPAVATGNFLLPLPPDNNRHAVYLKLGQLPIGRYRLLFSNVPIKADSYDLNNLAFEVTGIAAVNTDERIFVLNRKTGFPLAGAHIKAFNKKAAINKEIPDVNNNGYVNIAEGVADSITITYKGDTTGYKFYVRNNKLQDNIYNKDEYDDLNEFYDDKLRMEIFTDRSIYRPGQTVHYKIIPLTKDPNTGDAILFNSQNLGAGIFKSRLKKWFDDSNDKITLKDPFGKKIDSAVLKINDFGSFAGSFTLPKAAATGSWRVDGMPQTNYNNNNNNNGRFKVEEYKRPTIELSMEKQKKMLMPGEPFKIKLKLRSLSGADLGNIPINYTISRNGRVPSKNSRPNGYSGDYVNVQLKKKTGYTDEKGELFIPVSDSVVAKATLNDSLAWSYSYSLNATAVDAAGESTVLYETLNISSRPIKINIPVLKTYDRQVLPILNVSTSADFEGVVGRKVNIKLYKINNPDLNESNIKYVDQWYHKESDWNTWFPDKAVHARVKEEKTLVLDTVINTATYEKFALLQENIQSGFFQLLAECKDNGRIIGQASYNFNVFDSKIGNVPVDNIDYLPFNTAKAGDMLTWYSSGKTARQDEHWQTTKATAAAIDMLQKEKGNAFGETKAFSAQITGHDLSVSDGLLDGVPAAFAEVKQLPEKIELQQQGNGVSGALTWYYFAKPTRLDTLSKAVKISKQFYTFDKGKGLIKLTPNTLLKAGDRVQVKLVIETASRLKFVQVSDPRAAAFEPKENNSGYKYSPAFYYYQSVRDTGLELFAEAIPKGISEITYELVVAHDGEFTSGPARLQCMYQPALTAYSGVEKIKTN
jgi:hypothetical protein